MGGFRALSPNINVNTSSPQLRTELQNTFARLDGTLTLAPYRVFVNVGPADNSGSSETTLFQYIIEQGSLNQVGSSIMIHAAGKTAANANNKTLRLYLNTTMVFDSGALAMNNVDWTLKGEIIFLSGTVQMVYMEFQRSGGTPIISTTYSSESFNVNVPVYLKGLGTSNADISAYYWKGLFLK